MDAQGCIIEYVVCGGLLKVSAIDPNSGAEAVVYGPQHQSRDALTRLALRKLQYVMNRTKDKEYIDEV